MMHFITDHTARGVLRGLIRQVAQDTPPMAEVKSKMYLCGKGSTTTVKAANRFKDFIAPFAFGTRVTKSVDAHIVRANVVRFTEGEQGWFCHVDVFKATFAKVGVLLEVELCDMGFSGHALARLFQRASVIAKDEVFRELSVASYFAFFWDTLIARGVKVYQVACPTEKGIFLGQVDYTPNPDGKRGAKYRVVVRTFVPDGKKRFDDIKMMMITIHNAFQQHLPKGAWTEEEYNRVLKTTGTVMEEMVNKYTPWVLQPYVGNEE